MKNSLKFLYFLPVLFVAGMLGKMVWDRSKPPAAHILSGKPFATTPITNLTANLYTPEGRLNPAANDVFIEFRDAAGKLVDVGEVRFDLAMTQPGQVIHSIFKVLRTSTPGQYRVNVAPEIAGDWKAKLLITAPPFQSEASFIVTVK